MGLPDIASYSFVKDVACIFGALLLAGCATPLSAPQLEPDNVSFRGIQDALSSSGEPPDVLLVHGMCTHTKRDLQGANAALAKALNMEPQRSQDVALLRIWGHDHEAQLFTSTLSDGVRSVRTYSLLWSPIVTRYKRVRLCYDVSEATESCTKEVLTYAKPRALINRLAKDVLLDDCLADAVFYSAPEGGELLRTAALKAVVSALAGAKESARNDVELLSDAAERTTPFFMVTHSLGSKIIVDALHSVVQTPGDSLTLALGRTYQLFMEANQLPILLVGVGPIAGRTGASNVSSDPAMQALVERIAEGRRRNRGPRVLKDEPIVIVAFSDPNDLLSWGLRDSAVRLDGAKIVDAWVSNAATWIGAVENPLTAHIGYATNPAVARLIACGWKGSSAILACR